MPEQSELPVRILIDGKQVESETRVTSIGPYVLVLDTAIPESAVQLHSTYVGHKRTSTRATCPTYRPSTLTSKPREKLPPSHSSYC